MQQIEVEKKSFLPIYRQIADYLRQDLLSGKSTLCDTDGKLPSEQRIAKAFSTTRVTLRKALKILESEGLIIQYPGKGTFIVQETQKKIIGTKRIGFLGFTLGNMEFNLHRSSVFMGIEQSLTKQFPTENILLHVSPLEGEFSKKINEIKEMNLDGLFVMVDLDQIPDLLQSELQKIPHVVVCNSNSELQQAGFNLIDVDNVKGISLLIEHLQLMGHRKIAFVGGEPVLRHDALMRQKAFSQAVTQLGLDQADCPVILGHPSIEEAVEILLEKHKDITAIVTAGYFLAADTMQALQTHDIKIPDDISITGFDYFPDTQKFIKPSITTIRTPIFEMGVKAGEMLWKQVLNKPIEKQEMMNVELLVQQTTTTVRKFNP